MLTRYTILLFSFLWLASGCKTAEPAIDFQIVDAPAGFQVISDSMQSDPDLDAIIAPYRARLKEAISEVIGSTDIELIKGDPESPLGNLAADAMLQVANDISGKPVHLALTNNGGLRVSIAPGPITVGEIFELMPFENMMVVIELTASQVDSLAQQIAAVGGEPIAGFSFSFDDKTRAVSNIRVNNAPLDASKTYRLVTSDYLANGGGRLPALWHPADREDLNMLLRDAYIQYIRDTGVVNPVLDGRITIIN